MGYNKWKADDIPVSSVLAIRAVRARIAFGVVAAFLVWWLAVIPWRLSFRQAPEISFTTIAGEELRLSDFHGHPVLVTFWASDCKTCLSEIPELAKLYREFSGEGFQMIAIAMHYDLPSRVLALVESANVPYRVALDSAVALAGAFGRVEVVPTTFLIAPDGFIRHRSLGAIDFALVRKQILSMLRES